MAWVNPGELRNGQPSPAALGLQRVLSKAHGCPVSDTHVLLLSAEHGAGSVGSECRSPAGCADEGRGLEKHTQGPPDPSLLQTQRCQPWAQMSRNPSGANSIVTSNSSLNLQSWSEGTVTVPVGPRGPSRGSSRTWPGLELLVKTSSGHGSPVPPAWQQLLCQRRAPTCTLR